MTRAGRGAALILSAAWTAAWLLAAAPPAAGRAPDAEPPPAPVQEPDRDPDDGEPLLGAAADIAPESPAETVRVAAGSRLLRTPYRGASILAVIETELELPIVERRDGWVRIALGDWLGWLAPPLEPGAGGGEAAAAASQPLLPPSELAADGERLAAALALLGPRSETRELEAWTLHTDVDDPPLVERLRRTATHLPAAWAGRTGIQPRLDARGAVVVFEREQSYRAFHGQDDEIADLEVAGHAGHGVAALYAGDREDDQTARLFVHELVHLLNRATLGRDLPAWLEEGLANDLAFSRQDRDGRLIPGSLAGRRWVSPGVERDVRGLRRTQTLLLDGPTAALSQLLREIAVGRAVPLATLTDLTWAEFVRPDGRQTRYAQSAFFVRYLLAGEKGALAAGFRNWLLRLAAGERLPPGALVEELGRDWPRLESGFRTWIRSGGGGG